MRSLLIHSFLQSNQPETADAEFQTLLGLYPADREVWQRWHESQKKAGPGDVKSSLDSDESRLSNRWAYHLPPTGPTTVHDL
jgi:hypothetical protein